MQMVGGQWAAAVQAASLFKLKIIVPYNKHCNVWNDHECKNGMKANCVICGCKYSDFLGLRM